MKNLQVITLYLKEPRRILLYLNRFKIGRLFPDAFYLKCLYRVRLGKKLDLQDPKTFTEKLQWLKLYDRKPEYTAMVDKWEAKKVAAEKIGPEYVIPTLGVWERFEEIPLAELPERFVLKCTHNSGGVVVCRDKNDMDWEAVRRQLNQLLAQNYFWSGREWPYKHVKPRILAEQYMEDIRNGVSQDALVVYKVMTFGGVPEIIQVIQGDKTSAETIDYFDTDWNLLDIRQNFPNSTTHLPRPQTLAEMLSLASRISQGFAFLRVDFYEVCGRLYFSEFTFYSDSGTAGFQPEEWDRILGEKIHLPSLK